jgi:hypothetical protein
LQLIWTVILGKQEVPTPRSEVTILSFEDAKVVKAETKRAQMKVANLDSYQVSTMWNHPLARV